MQLRIEGLERLKAKMEALKQKVMGQNNVVVVGFTQRYAKKVHEDLEAHHKEGKQAKYLESPARSKSSEIRQVIGKVYTQTKRMDKALLMGGLRLQREAQLIVPIDTAALKASAFTCYQNELGTTAAVAYARSEAIRLAEIGRRAKRKKGKGKKR